MPVSRFSQRQQALPAALFYRPKNAPGPRPRTPEAPPTTERTWSCCSGFAALPLLDPRYCPGYTLSQSVSCSVGHGARICAATAPPRAELDFAPTAREQDRPRSTTAKNVIAEIGSLLEPLWKLEARISPWIRRICAAQAPIRNVATPPSRR